MSRDPTTGDVIVINQAYTVKTSKSGKQRTTITISSEPLIHNMDAKQAGKPVAEAIAQIIRDGIAGITQVASAATLRARERAAKNGDQQRRYAGGRMGAMAAGQSDKLFNDSGRLAVGIVANPTKNNEWVINVPANRLDPATFSPGKHGSAMAALKTEVMDRLAQLVPAIGNPKSMLDSLPFRRAVKAAMSAMIVKSSARIDELKQERVKAAIGRLRSVA